MLHAIRMPKPGQMTEECVLVAWHKHEGDPVRRGDVLFEIETDKAVMDVEAFDDGTLLRTMVDEGTTVPVNAIVAYLGDPSDTVPEDEPTTWGPIAEPIEPPPATPGGAFASSEEPPKISPRATRLAVAAGIDPRTVAGTGPGGRIVERDIRAALAASAVAVAAPITAEVGHGNGHGPAAAPGPVSAPSPVSAPVAPSALPGTPPTDDDAPRPLSRIRQVIARRMTESATIPQFSVTVVVDVAHLQAIRETLKATAGTAPTITDFVLHAAARTVAEFPDLNARTDGTVVWPRRRVHLGVAVSAPAGLLVAVLRDADRRTLRDLHDDLTSLVTRAREGTLGPDDMTGATFAVTNLGMFGVDEFTALLNPGEAAILAVGSVVPTPVAVGDGIAVRPVMKLTLSADHRLVDGELAARFLNALRRRLQDAEELRRIGLDVEG